MLLTATKEFTWDMAHMLENHEGLCINLHGHTYKMLVTVSRPVKGPSLQTAGAALGMVMDFKRLKEIVREELIDDLDHATMINEYSHDAVEEELYSLLRRHDRKIYRFPGRPTAENMCLEFFNILSKALYLKEGVVLQALRIYETPTSYAEVTL